MIGKKILQTVIGSGAATRTSGNAHKRILLMTGSDDLRQLSTEVLASFGYEARSAKDAEAAWDELQSDNYDLVVTDFEMADSSGIRLPNRLRATRTEVPVIMTSTSLPPKELVRHPWIRPAATLQMPYTVAEFMGTVRDVLRVTAIDGTQSGPPPKGNGASSAGGLQF